MAKQFIGRVEILNDDTKDPLLVLEGGDVVLAGEGDGRNPFITLRDHSENGSLWVMGSQGQSLHLGGAGTIRFQSAKGKTLLYLDARSGKMTLGSDGRNGEILLGGKKGEQRVRLAGAEGNLWLGGNGADGDLVLFRSNGDNTSAKKSTIHLDGQEANLFLGGNGADGDLVLKSKNGRRRIRLDGEYGNLWLGGNGADGDIALFRSNGDNRSIKQASIHLNGNRGDIVLQNGDCAEDFDIAPEARLEKGRIAILNDEGQLEESREAYDTRVAGIVAGYGDLRPAIVLGHQPTNARRLPVALVGKAYCFTDARFGAVKPGDLLTTSPTPGHAMRVESASRAVGCVVGKALQPLENGQGAIPVLVSLR